ncbi:hypothetical protein [Achromobacter aegrifaciens]|uniref:hypothetical protein n=1 Tax=Achromobacter aegrifaciens TaxID=1287736 RepID=UPI000F738D13|nr:hypothetical protein [Achromobacter aegrifaciens]RSF09285.1 hypothetical protein EGU54_00175 [Achromobacter aegrifaciens]
MIKVTHLPTSAATPVINPPRRGRLPAKVHRLRTLAAIGDTVRITIGGNAGKLCRVVDMKGAQLRIAALKGAIRSVDGENIAEAWIERSRVCRVAAQKAEQRQYSLPAWPKRWEVALNQAIGGQP